MNAPSTVKPSRVLVFGGTFDPPHAAHVKLPALAAEHLNCEEILYVPAAVNPLKTDRPPTAPEHRLAMLRLAIADVPKARICTLELERTGPSYTIDTLGELRQQYAGGSTVRFTLLMGCDQTLEFHRWRDWRRILELATPAVMVRPPWDETSFHAALHERYSKLEASQWMERIVPLPRMDVTATDVRRLIREGANGRLHEWVSGAVLEYIRRNHLYAK